MIYSSGAKRPRIDRSAYVAPTAIVSGDVTIAAGCAVLHGAVIVAEGAPVEIGEECVVMEHAVLRATSKRLTLGERCVIAPHAYVVDASLPADSHVPIAAAQGENVRSRNAQTYADFLRKAHADDAAVDTPKRTAPKQPSVPEEIPEAPHVEGVDNAMMLELAEMERRRQETLRKRGGK
ncbi:MAG TPA: hypothetical protein VMV82_04210 [Candidatus Dormibacteraeota bacterium]|nr:hypothetical protein [Candidatus Dormibacteraeota bacterium]